MEKKIDVTSTAVEKGLDMAKSFLDKLIMPAVEEVGLLVKDHVTMWRFNNQLRMVNKAKVYCDKHDINPKTISLKVLSPLLEYSGLEEDEGLQDKWAILLGNMVDSDQNVENHVFPYILSQISKTEFNVVDEAAKDKIERIRKLENERDQFSIEKPAIEAKFKKEIKEIEDQIKEIEVDAKGKGWWETREIRDKKSKVEASLRALGYREAQFRYQIAAPEEIKSSKLQEFEISNLIRLGLIKELREPFANSKSLEIPNDPDKQYLTIDFDIEVESNDSIILTELGELFAQACTEKTIK